MGDVEPLLILLLVDKLNGEFSRSFIRFDQHENFAENLTEIAAVDFIDDKHIGPVGIISGALAKFEEYAVLQTEAARRPRRRPVPTNKIVVRIGLVELYHFDPAVIAGFYERIGQFPRDECLADAGRALENQVLFSNRDDAWLAADHLPA